MWLQLFLKTTEIVYALSMKPIWGIVIDLSHRKTPRVFIEYWREKKRTFGLREGVFFSSIFNEYSMWFSIHSFIFVVKNRIKFKEAVSNCQFEYILNLSMKFLHSYRLHHKSPAYFDFLNIISFVNGVHSISYSKYKWKLFKTKNKLSYVNTSYLFHIYKIIVHNPLFYPIICLRPYQTMIK